MAACVAHRSLFPYLATVVAAWLALVPLSPATAERASPSVSRPTALKARIAQSNTITSFEIDLSRSVRVSVFTLARPYRLVIDLPETDFKLPTELPARSAGLIKDYRFGLLAAGKSRIVLDLVRAFKLVDVRAVLQNNGRSTISLQIAPVDPSRFRPQGVAPSLPPAAGLRRGVFESEGPGGQQPSRRGPRPVIVLDPGHGGPDPGAVGYGRTLEKLVVLAMARRIRDALQRTGRYRIVLTRNRDVFVSLNDRVALARRVRADLFISLHADAVPARSSASKIRGASIYTLSRRASDKQARAFAEKENASDAAAGLKVADQNANGPIQAILFDLMRRETTAFSERLSTILVRNLGRSISMSRSPRRAAAFRVLQQPAVPSVLIELGYMSNPSDVREMTRPVWQKTAARSIVGAINAYFDTRDRRN